MTDRDQFAAAAMTGLISGCDRYQIAVVARQAYELADEMVRKGQEDIRPAMILSANEIAALKHAIVWLPPAYAPQHDALRRLLTRATQ